MAHDFYPFVDTSNSELETISSPTRIAIYDDAAAAPRVVVIEPSDIRTYLETITQEVTHLSHEQGGTIPFMVIREVVENLIHAYFIEPIVSILPGGNTIRFSDQGPGIPNKSRALEYGTTTATEEMKRYIRGVGSGLPYVQQYLLDKGGSLLIEDNMGKGTIVTISMGTSISKEDLITTVQPDNNQQPALAGVSERGQLILEYLRSFDRVGPSDLVEVYGHSTATWSRELQALDELGILYKQRNGQKRLLTDTAKRLLQQ